MKHFIFTIILFATLLMANALQFSQCSGNYPNPVNVSILPDPPIFGQPVEVFISIMAYTTVEVGAYVDIQVNNPDWVFPFTFQQDICNDNYVKNCPISDTYQFNYPYYFLVGSKTLTVNIKARLVNPDNTILSCIDGSVTIQAPVSQK
ncbi:uncharacterized protein OCT59_011878 [Rhizophagus irregularis]|uniref:Phosphatidylglycerol/phosphatidylinositol transfer protein n=4 Tax=Rhizophagus irregularis TaxID=588596 RepID=A0A2P4PTS1_RHIID|nr:hypothetical protein GLOIN_2v1632724 [Rhizophagus irregularis DAOM 181602=DAOM 197198]POG68777.1 hypothetical protein GLOIN_2v1632724 [Rhizophagus irregularis DAOM 181602=DAOM 197198]UZO00759.1 hypothetical protein OCT59_011878 [Rhizophagus irregularis]|eukprot:XP_025175643.1 hypothetical protein GLOIN_2v1632724 [Rhizophagus irregularis DAOM 181602=DAOM 197198]